MQGVIHIDELEKGLSHLGLDLDHEQSVSLFEMLDVDHQGQIDFDEFKRCAQRAGLRRAAMEADALALLLVTGQ